MTTTAISIIQPQGNLMAPALMAMGAIIIVSITTLTIAIRWTTAAIRGRL